MNGSRLQDPHVVIVSPIPLISYIFEEISSLAGKLTPFGFNVATKILRSFDSRSVAVAGFPELLRLPLSRRQRYISRTVELSKVSYMNSNPEVSQPSTDAIRTAPDPNQSGMPGGVPFIVVNELAERFSFYGMKGILTIFMTKHLLDASGELVHVSPNDAKGIYHLFTAGAYFFPLLGAIVADVFWGKYKTILWISLMYCVGHGALALMDLGPVTGLWDMAPFLYAGLVFIAIGAGGIKPCVSAHVGDQFGTSNKHLLTTVYNWFYFSINLGAAASNLITPLLLAKVGPWAAFGLPGVLMAMATFVFWLGRHTFVHVPPSGIKKFKEETFSPEGRQALKNLAPLFLIFVPVFWAIYDQTGSAWVLQAEGMDRQFLGINWLESQIQMLNPILILTLIPLFTYVLYPLMGRFFEPTPLRKIGIGFVLTAAAFSVSGLIEMSIQAGATPNIGWQFVAYLLLTAAEVMVSIVCLEFAYTQSPPRMKSFIMGVYFLGVSFGNLFVSGLNFLLERMKRPDGSTALDGATYYWFFVGLMLVTLFFYIFFARRYKGQMFIQGEN